MKKLLCYCLFFYTLTSFTQIGKINQDFLAKIDEEGMKFYKFKKKGKKEKFFPVKYLPKDKTIFYDGKNVQLILMGRIFTSDVFSGNIRHQKTSVISMLFAKKINEDIFTFIGYYPGRRDEISIVPFKKHAALYIDDYPELAEKVRKKKKGYDRYNALPVFKEYDNWLEKNK